MTKLKALRWKINHWVWDDSPLWIPEWVESIVLKTVCLVLGHIPERDNCNKPEHDFCIYCNKAMPYAYKG